MADQSSSSPSRPAGQGIHRQQLMLIGVLGAGLLVVVFYGQPGSGDSNTEGVDTAGTVDVLPSRRPSRVASATSQKERWPTLALDRVIATNPFAELALPPGTVVPPLPPVEEPVHEPVESVEPETTPDDPQEETATDMLEVIAEMKARKVKMIFQTNGKSSALIGDRMVQEGEIIDGFRVVTIGPNGVTVRPVTPE